jgi:DNA-binding transcriptional regulator YiaG
MPILGAALRAELATAVGLKSLRSELRTELRSVALKKIRTLLAVARRATLRAAPGQTASEAAPAIPAPRIRALREALGESRKAFAKRLGVSSSIVFLWESGRSAPRRTAIVARLQRLLAAPPARAAARSSSPGTRPAARERSKRSLTLSPQRRAALKLQGQYMGHLRNLKTRQKAQVKAAKAAKGYPAAITLARKLAGA